MMDRLAVAVFAEESVTLAVKVKLPDVVGVPLMEPAEERVRPPGRAPEETVQVYPVPLPPLATRVAEYATSTIPEASEPVVTVSAGGVAESMVMERFAVAVLVDESVTLAVKGKLPDAVGVPEMDPAEERDSPPGSDPEETVHE